MKITDVQACVVGREEPFSGGSVWTFVRVYIDQGIGVELNDEAARSLLWNGDSYFD